MARCMVAHPASNNPPLLDTQDMSSVPLGEVMLEQALGGVVEGEEGLRGAVCLVHCSTPALGTGLGAKRAMFAG